MKSSLLSLVIKCKLKQRADDNMGRAGVTLTFVNASATSRKECLAHTWNKVS